MANFIVTRKDGCIAPISFDVGTRFFRVQFYKREGKGRLDTQTPVGMMQQYEKIQWPGLRISLIDQGCTIKCNTWITDHVRVAPIEWNVNGVPIAFEAWADMTWEDGRETTSFSATAITKEAAVKAFWSGWSQYAKENHWPTDVGVIGSERHPSRIYLLIAATPK